MFQYPARRASARPASASRKADDAALERPVCGLFPAYPAPDAGADAHAAPPAKLVDTPATAARAERARRKFQEVMYIEAPVRMGRHPVREMPVYKPFVPPAFGRVSPPSHQAPRALTRTTGSRRAHGGAVRWAEEPLVVGIALLACFPIGVALLWASPRFSRDARLALTAFTGFVLALGALVVIARP